MDKERHKKLQDDLKKLLEEFEQETGFMVREIEIRRYYHSSTSQLPPTITGLYVPVVPQ